MTVAGPADKGFNVEWGVVKECEELMVFFVWNVTYVVLCWNGIWSERKWGAHGFFFGFVVRHVLESYVQRCGARE